MQEITESTDEAEVKKTLPIPANSTRYPFGLTFSEMQVACVILHSPNASRSEIAEFLVLSENTVKTHLAAIFKKLDVTARWQVGEVLKQTEFTFGGFTNTPTSNQKPSAFSMQLA